MNGFIMHVGHRNNIDIDYTIKRRRSFDEVATALPNGPEREYFANDQHVRAAFPAGVFSCWSVPPLARPSFIETAVGDVVFFAPWIGVHGGAVRYIGVVKAISESCFPDSMAENS